MAKEDGKIIRYYMCSMCGFVSDNVIPIKCPECGAGKEDFVETK